MGAADAAGLWDAANAARLLGIGYCARLLSVDLYAKTRTRGWFAAELRSYARVLRKVVG